jgi:hypothetical protein
LRLRTTEIRDDLLKPLARICLSFPGSVCARAWIDIQKCVEVSLSVGSGGLLPLAELLNDGEEEVVDFVLSPTKLFMKEA